MCRKLSMAISGKSSFDFPRWCRGCANFSPSAIKKLTFSENKSFQLGYFWIKMFLKTWKMIFLLGFYEYFRVWMFLRLSSSKYFCTTSEYCFTDSLSSGLWNNMRKGRPSSVNSSAFSNVISRTRGEHLSATHALISSYLFHQSYGK